MKAIDFNGFDTSGFSSHFITIRTMPMLLEIWLNLENFILKSSFSESFDTFLA